MILKSKETKEIRIFLGEEERRRRRKKGPIESRVHELKTNQVLDWNSINIKTLSDTHKFENVPL